MQEQPFVSVVVPTYNRKELLEKCINSLLTQTYPNYEIIVVDDGSSDGTREILNEYAGKHEILSYYPQSNQGPAAARNMGIEKSKGEIICFTDDDCIAEKDWIENLVNGFVDDEVGGVGGEILGYRPETLIERYIVKNRLLDQRLFIKLFITTANGAYRKNLLKDVGGFDRKISTVGGEDTDIGIRVKMRGKRLEYTSKAVVHHKHRSTLKALLKQFHRYGRSYAFLHKKYPAYFNPRKRATHFLRRLLFRLLAVPYRPLKVFYSEDKLLCTAEPIIDIMLYSAELLGVVRQSMFGDEYRGEKIYDKLEFIEKANVLRGWGV